MSHQANDSTPGSYESFGTLFEDEKSDGDIFFELDSILQCVDDFCYEEKAQPVGGFQHAASHMPAVAVAAAVERRVDVKPGSGNESLLRDDELRWTETVAMIDAPHGSTGGLSVTPPPAKYSLSPTADATAPPTSDSKGPKPKNQNRSRKRQREEIERLRMSVEEMQLQLQTLLSGSDQPRNLSQRQIQSYLQENLAWKRAASIDKELAERGTVENLKLRALIQEHELIYKSLSEICSKFHVPNAHQDVGPGITYVDMEKRAVVPDLATFDLLHQGLDTQYQQLNAVWSECNFTNAKVETKVRNQIRSDGDGQRYFECTKGHIFSFSTTAVSQTIWRLMKIGLLTPNNGEFKVCRVMGNTLNIMLNDTVVLPNTPDSKIRAWIAMKRFIEDDRIVTVWRAKMEIQRTSTVRLTEHGWNVTRGLVGTRKVGDSLKTAPCISQTCIHSFSGPDCSLSRAEMFTGSSTEKIVRQYHQNMNLLNQKIENMLLDESTASRGAT